MAKQTRNKLIGALMTSFTEAAGLSRSKDIFSPLTPMNLLDWGMSGRIQKYETKREQLSANVGFVYAANQLIAEACAAVELKLYKVDAKGDRTELMQHDILTLLDRPNYSLTGEQMRQLHFSYMNFNGESYMLETNGAQLFEPAKGRLPNALHVLPSHRVEFHLGENSYMESYVRLDGKQDYNITTLLRDINPDPSNPYYGRSVIQAAAATIDTENQMKEWNRRLFANGARPSAIVTTPDVMDDKPYKRFQQQVNDQHTGTANAHKPWILEGGADIKPFQLTQTDLDFLESRKFSKDEILAMFRMSPAMLGMTENVNRSNAETSEYIFAKYVVLPRVKQFVNMLNAQLIKPFDETLELGFENPVPEDKDAKRSDATGGIDKWLTIDEVREMYGLEELPDGVGTVLYRPVNLVPLVQEETPNGDAGTGEGDDMDDDDDGDEPDDDDSAADAQGDDETPPKSGKSKKKVASRFRSKTVTRIGEAKATEYELNAKPYEKQVMTVMRRQFDAQQDAIHAAIDTHKLDKALYTKGVLDDLIDWAIMTLQMTKALKPVLLALIGDTGKMAMGEVADPSMFDPFSKNIQAFYDQRATSVASDINAETEKQLRATLAEGIKAGETSFQLKARVSAVMGNAASYRAERIARTEVANAQGFADCEAWHQSGVVSSKEWYTAEDEMVCPFCASLDGKQQDLTDNFFDKGDSLTAVNDKGKEVSMTFGYQDINTNPLHVNCRCVLLPIVQRV